MRKIIIVSLLLILISIAIVVALKIKKGIAILPPTSTTPYGGAMHTILTQEGKNLFLDIGANFNEVAKNLGMPLGYSDECIHFKYETKAYNEDKEIEELTESSGIYNEMNNKIAFTPGTSFQDKARIYAETLWVIYTVDKDKEKIIWQGKTRSKYISWVQAK